MNKTEPDWLVRHRLAINQVKIIGSFSGFEFGLVQKGEGAYLIGRYYEQDIAGAGMQLQSTRKWYLSPHATHSEVVQTAFKCLITSAEHRVRESFTYRDARVFGPHFDVNALVDICEEKKFDYREPNLQDGRENNNEKEVENAY